MRWKGFLARWAIFSAHLIGRLGYGLAWTLLEDALGSLDVFLAQHSAAETLLAAKCAGAHITAGREHVSQDIGNLAKPPFEYRLLAVELHVFRSAYRLGEAQGTS